MADSKGKRVAAKAEKPTKPPKEKKSPVGKVLLVLVLLVVGYFGLCGWVFLNGIDVLGEVRYEQLGWTFQNMTSDQLDAELDKRLAEFKNLSSTFEYNGQTVVFDQSVIDFDRQQMAGHATVHKLYTPFYLFGAQYLFPQAYSKVSPFNGLTRVDQAAFDAKIAEVTALVSQTEGQTSYERLEDSLHFVKGTSYQTLDVEKLMQLLFSADVFVNHNEPMAVPVTVKSAGDFDMGAVARQFRVEPVSAVFDVESKSILPHVTGVSLDVAAAQAEYDAAAEGSRFIVDLILTEPEMTAEQLEETLFRDVLGHSDTYVGGVSNRVSNVRLMATAVNEMVLLPGEVFSYLGVMNANRGGFLEAPAYVKGETVDEVGGGICQVSSMIYYCVFHADLKVVQRAQHAYVVGYIKDGLDATVFNPAPDFKFENDTDQPIKIVSTMTGRNLSVSILGTKTNDHVVSFERAYSDQKPYETIYEFNEAVPVGKVEEKVSGYTGVKVVVWKVIHDAEGNLISRELESTNTYRRRDRILMINPADAAAHGQEPPEGTVLPTPTPEVPEGIPTEPVVPVEPTPEVPAAPIPPVETEPTPEVTVPEGIPAA